MERVGPRRDHDARPARRVHRRDAPQRVAARRDLAARWSQLLYYYIHIGSILLIAGILTGSIWAASSWGRYWGWDPKEVWSLVAFLAYMAILHARFDEQIHAFGVAVSSIAAFWTILMTYLGVNYVLAAGLHSYGFGSSNLVAIMAVIAAAEIAFLAYMAILHARFDEQIRDFGVAACSIAAFWTILMTYLGVNFVLNVGMHSYGMGDSPVVKWMVLVGIAELVYVLVCVVSYRDRRLAAA